MVLSVWAYWIDESNCQSLSVPNGFITHWVRVEYPVKLMGKSGKLISMVCCFSSKFTNPGRLVLPLLSFLTKIGKIG